MILYIICAILTFFISFYLLSTPYDDSSVIAGNGLMSIIYGAFWPIILVGMLFFVLCKSLYKVISIIKYKKESK